MERDVTLVRVEDGSDASRERRRRIDVGSSAKETRGYNALFVRVTVSGEG